MSENRNYKRTVIAGNDSFEIVSCEWTKGSVSPLHDHSWSQCFILVKEGVFENRAEFGLKTELSLYETGQVISTPLGVDHEIVCISPAGKTLHVYVPNIKSETDRFRPTSLSSIRQALEIGLTSSPLKWKELEIELEKIRENSISTSSPMFMNQLFSGVFPETLAAEQIVAKSRTTMATFEASPAFTAVELEVIDRLCELAGWPSESRDGIGVPGGSAANFMAVHCARQRRVPEYRKRGSRGEQFKVFVSKEAHYSLKKACLATGIGTDALIEVATDSSGRMSPTDLEAKIKSTLAAGAIPLLVCATAGTTVLGAFDPIDMIADIAADHGVWLHVDGAWGAPAMFSKKARTLMTGIERADSLTFDAHKLFGSNLTCSFFLTKHRGLLLEANDVSGGDYIFHSNEVTADRGRLSWQCGRGADALSFWTLWKSNGTDGLANFVDRLFTVRDECVTWIKSQPRLQLIADPTYLNVCVRVLAPESSDPDWSKKVREQLKADNVAFVNFSSDKDGTFLRLILAHPKLEIGHLQTILQRAIGIR